MEYLLVVDGVQEDMVASGTSSGNWSCTPVTDYFSYANRLWTVGSGDVTGIVYGTCDSCLTSPPSPPTAGASTILLVFRLCSFPESSGITFIRFTLLLQITAHGNSIYVEVESADSDPVDLLIINSATPAPTALNMEQ